MNQRNPYFILDVSVAASADEIHSAFMTRMSADPFACNQARTELEDPTRRLVWDTQMLDTEQWLGELRTVRDRYALFDHISELRQ